MEVNCSSYCSVQFSVDRENPFLLGQGIFQKKSQQNVLMVWMGFVKECLLQFRPTIIWAKQVRYQAWSLICHLAVGPLKVKGQDKDTFLPN